MINKETIEYKIFEFHEGDLSAVEQQEVLEFIQKHPEYQTDFDAMASSRVENESFTYQFADELLIQEGSSSRTFLKWAFSGGLLLLTLISFGLYTKLTDTTDTQTVAVNNNDTNKTENRLNQSEDYKAVDPTEASKQTTSSEHSSRHNYDELEAPTSTNLPSVQASSKNNQVVSGEKISTVTGALISPSNQVSNSNRNAPANGLSKEDAKNAFDAQFIAAVQKTRKEIAFDDAYIGVKERFSFDPLNLNGVLLKNDKDPIYANQEGMLISMNPAFAGNSEGVRVQYYYRSEWPRINEGNYLSQMMSIDTYVDALHGGVGIIYEDDVVGHNKFNSRSIGFFYSPKFEFNTFSVEPAAKYMHSSRSIQWGQMSGNTLVDPRTGFRHAEMTENTADISGSSTSSSYGNFGLGLLINHDKFFLGASLDQLNDVTYDFDGVSKSIQPNSSFTAQLGTEIRKGAESNLTYRPSFYYYSEGEWNSLWMMNQVKISNVVLGVAASINDAYMMQFGFDNRRVRFTYNYSLSKPPVGNAQYYGSHQLTMRLNFLPVK